MLFPGSSGWGSRSDPHRDADELEQPPPVAPPEVFLVDHSCGDFQQRGNRLLSCWRRQIKNGGQSLHCLMQILFIIAPCDNDDRKRRNTKSSKSCVKERVRVGKGKTELKEESPLFLGGRVMIDLDLCKRFYKFVFVILNRNPSTKLPFYMYMDRRGM